ncbi:MAG: hypothetical protein CMM85_06180 [Rhodothermaceae bacterium]|nr:hypothetical protein [Rhodothermaceae bacterium]
MRLLPTLLLAAGLTAAASAQSNTGSVVASGDANVATIDQSGNIVNTASIVQSGDNNTASQTQGAAPGFLPPIFFDATVDQSGDRNTVTQTQGNPFGNPNFGDTDSRVNAVQSGDDNSAEQTQTNSGCCTGGLNTSDLTVDQSGNNNTSVQNQYTLNWVGVQVNSGTVIQTGDDNTAEQQQEDNSTKTALIDQSGAFNTAFQGQDGNNNPAAGSLDASATQSGDMNDVSQLQIVASNAVGPVVQVATADQSGNNNVLYQELNHFVGSPFGNATHTATATQTGDDNDGTQVIGLLGGASPADASMSLDQSGDRNVSTQIQQSVNYGGGFSFSSASVSQTGDDNTASQTQDDLGDIEASITQAGTFNSATQYQDAESFEGDLDATISQAGTGNVATQDQRVDDRPGVATFAIHSADLTQDGTMNTSSQIQSGNGGHTSIATQIGDMNTFSIMQSGTLGHTSTHTQMGTNNNTTIVQN